MKRVLLDSSTGDIEGWLDQLGQPRYRARQMLNWVFERRIESFSGMSDLPKSVRDSLDEGWSVFGTQVVKHSIAPDGTDKLLLECSDSRTLETVLMAEGPRRTVCVSTQVGCGMGCVFCASGLKGLVRNLTKAEILEQAIRARNTLRTGERLTHMVVMGMGESLANLDNLIAALDIICSPDGLGLSQRRVTISTVGLPDKMHKLARMNRRYHLAVSLHAATESLRDELVPVNQRVGLKDVLEAADAYWRTTGRQITFEYVLLGGVNDRVEDARALASLMFARCAHVNLIPYNQVEGLAYRSPLAESIARFCEILKARGVSVTVRKTKGREIDAACGQLHQRWVDESSLVKSARKIERESLFEAGASVRPAGSF